MTILDESNLLSKSEKEAYALLLKRYNFALEDFRLKVTEDQKPMDMNDLTYVVELKIKVTQKKKEVTRTYVSSSGSGVWLEALEEDFKGKVF